MENAVKQQEDKSIDWLDLEFWPESDFKLEGMQSNQHYGWVTQNLDACDRDQAHGKHQLDHSLVQEHFAAAHAALTEFGQQSGEQVIAGMPGVRANLRTAFANAQQA
jgi:hypothetical protein